MGSFGGPPYGFDDFSTLGLWGEFDDVDVFAFESDDELFPCLFLGVECFEFFWCEVWLGCGVVGAEEEEKPEAVFACMGEVEAGVECLLVGFDV